jgi:hypothetical protein
MNRCVALMLSLLALPTLAQMQRNFPATALRGELVITAPPEAVLNGRNARLAPGARIRGENNMMLVSGAAINQRLIVHYTLDVEGQLLDLWVLTPQERSKQPWPTTLEQAQSWSFDPAAQAWVKP